MALINGSDYDHIDLQAGSGGDTTRHMLRDAVARSIVTQALGVEPIKMTAGAYYPLNGTSISIGSPTAYESEKYALVPCSAGDVFIVSGAGGSTARPWGFVKSDGEIITTADSDTLENAVLTAPQNSAYLVLNNQSSNSGVSYYGKFADDKARRNDKFIDFFEATEIKSLVSIPGGINASGVETNSSSTASSYSHSDYIPLKKGTRVTYTNVRVTNLCAIAAYDRNGTFDATSAIIAGTTISGDWTMPFDGYVRLCCRNTELESYASFVILNLPGVEIKALDERVDALENVLPDEWETYLSTRKAAIQSALLAIGDTGESFTFETDVHVPRNTMLTPRIIRRLDQDCAVNYHINGGDFIEINTDSVQSAISVMRQWKDAMHGITEYCIRGNHDNNNNSGSNGANEMTVGQFYALMTRQIENVIDTHGKTYYCIDNQSQKIRLILLDTTLADKTAMYAWLSTKLTELDASWTILVIQHHLWGATTESFHQYGQDTIDAINAVYGNINADFIGILAGHTHVDHNDTESVNGYLLIARDANLIKADTTGTNRLSFDYVTINTSAKTINFTKIGRGSDLSLSYGA